MTEHPEGPGLVQVGWDNIGQEWFAVCLCDETFSATYMEDIGRDFDEHVDEWRRTLKAGLAHE